LTKSFRTIRQIAVSGGFAALLATGNPVFAGEPSVPTDPLQPKTAPCLSAIEAPAAGLGQRFDVRDVKLYVRPASTPGNIIVTWGACVVANEIPVMRVTANAMLIDKQGRMIALTEGQPPNNPNPPTGLPRGAPPVLVFAGGDSPALSKAEWASMSTSIVIIVSWIDKDNVRHQDSFYVPYTLGAAHASKKG